MSEIIRSDEDVVHMHLLANRQSRTSRAPDYWHGVMDALTWLCAVNEAPALDVHWETFLKARGT